MNYQNIVHWQLQNPKKSVSIGVFTLAFALFISQLASFFYQDSQTPSVSPHIAQSHRQETINLKSPLFTTHLFGQYIPNSSEVEIKESALDLTVVGVLYSKEAKASQVVIRAGNGEERPFSVGDMLPGGAKIKEITEQGIVIWYHGALESLSLPQNALRFDKRAKPLKQE